MKFIPRLTSRRLLALALLAAAIAAPAQQPVTTQLNDPANLAGERVSPQDLADTLPIDHGAPALQQLLRKLRTRASFMLIVAHPDDEDGGMLTYLSRGQGARVAMLTLNRGEGGQNLMSADFDDALGLIRTQELLAADRYMGVDQFFGSEVDFGFSKTKEEAFAKWTHERVLYDAVRAVRLYRPLVIASVFIGAPSDGHGQHQVSGQIAQEVFKAAGDPNVFPDQIAAGLQPWQPLKVYARSPFGRIDSQGMYDYATGQYAPARFTNYVTGKVTTTVPKANVVIPEGTPDPLLGGLSYIQFAREGLALEKSQIGPNARLASPGVYDVSYHRYGSRVPGPDGKPQHDGDDDSTPEPSLFSGIDTSLEGISSLALTSPMELHPTLEAIDRDIAEAQRLFDPAHLELTAPPLREALRKLDGLLRLVDESKFGMPYAKSNLLHELRIKRVQLNNALVLSDGISLTAMIETPPTGDGLVSSPSKFEVATKLNNGAADAINLEALFLKPSLDSKSPNRVFPPLQHLPLARGSSRTDRITSQGSGLPPTRPYFSRSNIEQAFYDIADPNFRNSPITPNPLTVLARFEDHGVQIDIAAVVASQHGSSPREPAVFVPPVSVSLSRHAQALPLDKKAFHVSIHIRPSAASLEARLRGPAGWSFVPLPLQSIPGHPVFLATAPARLQEPVTLAASVPSKDGMIYSEGFRPVGYPGLTYTNYYIPATTRGVVVDVHTAPNLNIAYVPGTGDDVPAALEDLGVHPRLITVADLTSESLKSYDAVVLGVRAYEHHELAAANPALNAYAAAGGIVIAQYNTGRLPEDTGPYPLNLGDSEKVVEEDAPVRLLAPADPFLTWPNKIASADFDHWVEERGHGFMGSWDSHYMPLLETHDTGQQPQRGGLLVGRTGKGAWIYLGLALYRQFPEGVPGPYRLLANLISAAKNPAFVATPNTAM